MPDNVPAPEDPSKSASPPKSGVGPQRISLRPALQPGKKTALGKVIVMLSSVAKSPPPRTTQQITPGDSIPKPTIAITPLDKASPASAAGTRPAPARAESKEPGSKRTGPIKLNLLPRSLPSSTNQSVFLPEDAVPPPAEVLPSGWKALEPGELKQYEGDLQTLDVFSRSQRIEPKPTPALPAPKIVSPVTPPAFSKPSQDTKTPSVAPSLPQTKPIVVLPPVAPVVAPAALEPAVVLSSPAATTKTKVPVRPPPLPMPVAMTAPIVNPVKSGEKETPAAMQVAPPMKETSTTPEEKLPQPQLPTDVPKGEGTAVVVTKSPALSDAPPARKLPPPLPIRELTRSPAASVTVVPMISETKPPTITGPIVAREVKPTSEPGKPAPPPLPALKKAEVVEPAPTAKEIKTEPKMAAVTGPILARETRPAVEPEKTPAPVSPPPKKVELAVSAKSAGEIKIETKPPAITGPILLREIKSVTEPEKSPKPLTLPPKKAVSVPNPAPAVEPKIVTKPAAVTGPILERESKPALRPAVLPAKIIREKDAREKLDPPVQPDEKPAATQSSAPPLTGTIPGKPSGQEKLKSPVKIAEKPPLEVSSAPAPSEKKSPEKSPGSPAAVADSKRKAAPSTRAARAKRKRLMGAIFFYFLCVLFGPALWLIGSHFCHETRIEGQVIPPGGTLLGNEVWIVGDFRDEIAPYVEELADERTSKQREIQEPLNHVQRAQADIASREERLRLLQGQIQAAKDEIATTIKQVRAASQQIWEGPGADLDKEYDTRQEQLRKTIEDRAKSLNLNYQPDPTFNSPEVWANAYRLALYQVPSGVDSAKEHLWLEDQMKQWRAYTRSLDGRKQELRQKAAAIRQSPTTKVADLQANIDDLQHRMDSTQSEETPIKAELQDAQSELGKARAEEAGIDERYYKQLYALPEASITRRLPIEPNGRFSWHNIEKDTAFTEDVHSYWLFSRAIRADGQQYWALFQIDVRKDTTTALTIEPGAFLSTRAILRPDLSPDEQQQ